jgi:hypothetical protein
MTTIYKLPRKRRVFRKYRTMVQINNFDELMHYLNRLGVHFHGAGYIPRTQELWANIDAHLQAEEFTYPVNVRFFRDAQSLLVYDKPLHPTKGMYFCVWNLA